MNRKSDRLPPLNALRAFDAAARHLSFKRAALELHVTPGAVSHQVKQLEEYLGVALFKRLTRALELTREAQTILPKVREGLENFSEALDRLRAREEASALTVIAPPNFAARWLVPRLNGFTALHPELELHIASRQSMIDGRENDAVPVADAPEDAPVAQVRFGTGRYPGSRVDEVFAAEYVPVCSPKLLEGPHPLRTPEDLRFQTLLHDDTVLDESTRTTWSDWLEAAGVDDIDASRGPHFSDASLATEAAIEGMGVALLIKPLLCAEIEAGRLVVPFDIPSRTIFSYYLVTPEPIAERPAIVAFREWILEEARKARRL